MVWTPDVMGRWVNRVEYIRERSIIGREGPRRGSLIKKELLEQEKRKKYDPTCDMAITVLYWHNTCFLPSYNQASRAN